MPTTEMPQRPGLRNVAAAVAARIEQTMQADLAAALEGCDPLLTEILHYALFNGGKRIRPLLTVLSARCCGRDDADLLTLASAFEYLHVATLIHDDVIDRAELRRGKATLVARFGLAPAILAGDWLHARSMQLIGLLAGAEGLAIFTRATASMVNGEFAQLRLCGDVQADEAGYYQVIRQKTGNLIATACALGALFAGADDQRRAALTHYGDRIGTAFQVADDLLDYLGESGSTGKQIGNDFMEGKITLPLLLALKVAGETDRQRMTELIAGDRTLTAAYSEMHALIAAGGGFAAAAQAARRLVDEALEALHLFVSPGAEADNAALLRELAHYVLARTH